MRSLRWPRFWIAIGLLLVLSVVWLLLAPAPLDGIPNPMGDKLTHALVFAAMTGWFAGLLRPDTWWLLIAFMLGLGISTEVAQGMMQIGRVAEWRDFLADVAGIAVALLLASAGLGRWCEWLEQVLRRKA